MQDADDGNTIVKTKLRGVTFDSRQDNLPQVQDGFFLFWEHEEDNQYDPNAIHVYADPARTISLGHLSKDMAAKFCMWKRDGEDLKIICAQVTGGKKANQSYGMNVEIHRTK